MYFFFLRKLIQSTIKLIIKYIYSIIGWQTGQTVSIQNHFLYAMIYR